MSDFDENPVNNNCGSSQSLWMEIHLPSFPPLDKNLIADVCIVGAGIVGLTCAYTLAKAGKSVAVLDQGYVGGGQSARTTAHLTWALDDRYFTIEKNFGKEVARLAAESHSKAIDYMEQIVNEENIVCDWERVDGYLFVGPGDDVSFLDKEYEAIQKTGMSIKKAPKAPFSSIFDSGPCLHFPNQAQFHVLKYLQGLCKAIERFGGKIFTKSHVKKIEDSFPCVVETTSGAKIESNSVIMGTCTPVNDRFYIHTKQSSYQTYVIAAEIPKNSVEKGLYWDTLDPYHYVRTHRHLTNPELDWLIVGGNDHKTGQEIQENYFESIEKWAKRRFPMMGKIGYRWSGQVFEPVDSLAFIGRNPHDKNIYVATGESGNGMTYGTIAGMLLPDLILGKENPWKKLYEPSRKTLSTTWNFLEENMNSVFQYKDWFTPGEIKQIDELGQDEGIIFREGLKKIAVYKDTQSKVHVKSAVCPHLGGCVRWNSTEKTWDCPVHGSRFNGCGQVVGGPANSNLCSDYHWKNVMLQKDS